MLTGYLHPSYAESLTEFGNPWYLPRCEGWILQRQIPDAPYHDAIGCYPLFTCRNWSQLHADLEEIGRGLVSLALVADPFGTYDADYLQHAFKDVVIPFKEHFVIDLCRPLNEIVSRHHRYHARKSLNEVSVEVCQDPMQFIEEWISLYGTLIKRHNIGGIKAFSESAFIKQLNLPGLVMLRVVHQDITIGAQLWFIQGDIGYSHLTAFSEVAYKLRASYGLYWFAIDYFADKVRWLDLGAGAGVNSDGSDGLSAFKRGWSTGTKTAYFCGRIFDHERYAKIVEAKGTSPTDYFPGYRKGEFG